MPSRNEEYNRLVKIILISWFLMLALVLAVFVFALMFFTTRLNNIIRNFQDKETGTTQIITKEDPKPLGSNTITYSESLPLIKSMDPTSTLKVVEPTPPPEETQPMASSPPANYEPVPAEREKEIRTDPESGSLQWRYVGDKIWGDF